VRLLCSGWRSIARHGRTKPFGAILRLIDQAMTAPMLAVYLLIVAGESVRFFALKIGRPSASLPAQ
jgi:hypothetical protein